ncbi:hypothetical protein LTR08_006509 [Meristemomyces frigidus]|nr:hypothetical protein LTR08_006509 [Meristemomyces frigidus]
MFSKALSSFTSAISSTYTLAPHPTATAGPWQIFDAKRKSTGHPASVFVFSPKTLVEAAGGLGGGRGSASALRRTHEEVVERLKREASSLARLRHPSILELQEPVEETRGGGLMFAAEAVTASLAGLLAARDGVERGGGRKAGRGGSRYTADEPDGATQRGSELEFDELEIQKGLLQLAKGLEFLHASAGLVHANLTPDAILINAKGDWKIAGLAFCGPFEGSTAATSLPPINLHEVLNHDPRLPQSVQINLDYTSPDFVLDNSLTPSADIFSLGLLILALYNTPHTSPLTTNGSLSTYKRLFASPTTTPSPSNNFLLTPTHPLPPNLASDLLPHLLTRRPAQRLTATQFQESPHFNNILVSTIRFLDALPAKTAAEKLAFLRGLPTIVPQFPPRVLEKKVLPALLDELKDRDLLAPILTNVFAIATAMPPTTGKGSFTALVLPKLRAVFLTSTRAAPAAAAAAAEAQSRDAASKEAGLMVVLDNMQTAADNCPGKEFRDDILPLFLLAMESPTHGLVDAALGTLATVLPVLDFSTIKHDVFPVIAGVFAKTSSLAIKIRGLEAFCTLCGGGGAGVDNDDDDDDDDFDGIGVVEKRKRAGAGGGGAILDKFAVQEKVVPLLKGIKTKEPGVTMAALRVFRRVGEVADAEFLALEVLPALWAMSLGPLLDLRQFRAFMGLIRKLGTRIEAEQTRKLGEVGGGVGVGGGCVGRAVAASGTAGVGELAGGEAGDFEALVSGRGTTTRANGSGDGDLMSSNDWAGGAASTARLAVGSGSNTQPPTQPQSQPPTFAWQTPAAPPRTQTLRPALNALRPTGQLGRTVTPDQSLGGFAALTPASVFSVPLQPQRAPAFSGTAAAATTNGLALQRPAPQPVVQTNHGTGGLGGAGIDWSAAAASSNNASAAWASQKPAQAQGAATGRGGGGFGLPPPPVSGQAVGLVGGGFQGVRAPPPPSPQQPQKQVGGGLDRYESLL